MTEILIYLPLGVVAGVLAGLFGIGGGDYFCSRIATRV